MPNWCANSVTIRGPKELIRGLAQNSDSLLMAMVPRPESEEDNWYGWNVENWGTKWDVDGSGLEVLEDGDYCELVGMFDSAWSPPLEAFKAFAIANPEVSLELSYNETGLCFVGKLVVEGGEVVDDEYFDYSDETSDTVRDLIGADLDDEWGISDNMAEWEEENENE